MINRVLIRVKVVQMLYCYLLSQTEFKVPQQPAADASRDARYAYQLFLEVIRMIIEMEGISLRDLSKSPLRGIPTDKKLAKGQLGSHLWAIESLKDALKPANASELNAFDLVIPSIYKQIPTLPAYKTFSKQKDPDLNDEVTLWQSVLYNLMEKNKEFATVARRNPDFTYTGFHRGIQMAVDMLQSYNDNRALFLSTRSTLDHSLEMARQLYISLMYLPIAITQEIEHRQDEAKQKLLPTDEDLHPNLRLVENKYIQALNSDEEFQKALEGPHLLWRDDYTVISSFIKLLEDSELYKTYMSAPEEPTYEQDCDFWDMAMKTIILPSDALAETLESNSVFWNDDLQIIGEFVCKTMRRFARSNSQGAKVGILPMYKDKEDEKFGPKLFETAALNFHNYREIINQSLTGRWDGNRLALMDVVIMATAIAEMLTFPSIPVGVTLNEYVEIAGNYSTDRSREFVNAVLRQIADKLREQGQLIGK